MATHADDLRSTLTHTLEDLAQDLKHLTGYAEELGDQIEALCAELRALDHFHPHNRDDRY